MHWHSKKATILAAIFLGVASFWTLASTVSPETEESKEEKKAAEGFEKYFTHGVSIAPKAGIQYPYGLAVGKINGLDGKDKDTDHIIFVDGGRRLANSKVWFLENVKENGEFVVKPHMLFEATKRERMMERPILVNNRKTGLPDVIVSEVHDYLDLTGPSNEETEQQRIWYFRNPGPKVGKDGLASNSKLWTTDNPPAAHQVIGYAHHPYAISAGKLSSNTDKDVYDIAVGCHRGECLNDGGLLWFEATSTSPWIKHEIDTKIQHVRTCEIADIDGDGLMDVVVNTLTQVLWYRNPGNAEATKNEWKKTIIYPINEKQQETNFCHGQVVKVSEKLSDVLMISDKKILWFTNKGDGKGNFEPPVVIGEVTGVGFEVKTFSLNAKAFPDGIVTDGIKNPNLAFIATNMGEPHMDRKVRDRVGGRVTLFVWDVQNRKWNAIELITKDDKGNDVEKGYQCCIAIGDFNGDGNTDFVLSKIHETKPELILFLGKEQPKK